MTTLPTSPVDLRNAQLTKLRGHYVVVHLIKGIPLKGKLLDHDDTGLTLRGRDMPEIFVERHAVSSVIEDE